MQQAALKRQVLFFDWKTLFGVHKSLLQPIEVFYSWTR